MIQCKKIFAFQDNDFLNDGVKIHIGPEAKAVFMETLEADVDFLTKVKH